MRLFVTGREGQVVQSLLDRTRSRADLEIIAAGRPALDLASPETIMPAITAARPDVVVSAAAYTAVDQAEDEPELACAVNAEGAGAVAEAAARLGLPVVHLSTDYVFDGSKEGAYVESDATAPQNVYGASKLAGEKAVAAANPHHVILRTAWVYSPFGKNFVKTMLRLAQSRDSLDVVDDQRGNPTSALDIADAILAVAERRRKGETTQSGVFHFAGRGTTSWCGLAKCVFERSRLYGGPSAEVRAITSADFPTKAARPRNSQLDCGRFEATFGHTAPEWRDSVDEVVRRLLADR